MNKKYEITTETKEINGHMVYRIKALKSFDTIIGRRVNKGDLGGWVESEANLSHDGTCWLFDEAAGYENSRRCDNSVGYDRSRQFGNSQQSGNSRQHGDSRQYGASWQHGDSRQYGNSRHIAHDDLSAEAAERSGVLLELLIERKVENADMGNRVVL